MSSYIETIQDKNGNSCNTMALVNSIKHDVAGWLNEYGADNVMKAIEDNVGNTTKLFNQYTTAAHDNYWSEYWGSQSKCRLGNSLAEK